MLDNSDLMLPTNDLSSYIEVPEKRGSGKLHQKRRTLVILGSPSICMPARLFSSASVCVDTRISRAACFQWSTIMKHARRGDVLGVVSIVLAVAFWIYATSSSIGPSAFAQSVYVIFLLLPGVLIASALAAILAAFWGSKWWLFALLGPASGALLMLSASG
jgi:hypothetical protein